MGGRRRCMRGRWRWIWTMGILRASPSRSPTWGKWRTSKATTGGGRRGTRGPWPCAGSWGTRGGIAFSLTNLGAASCAQGQPERGTRLCAAAAALRTAIGAPLTPDERAIHEDTLASARAALGEEAFVAAWAHGQALPLEQAIAYALGEEASA